MALAHPRTADLVDVCLWAIRRFCQWGLTDRLIQSKGLFSWTFLAESCVNLNQRPLMGSWVLGLVGTV